MFKSFGKSAAAVLAACLVVAGASLPGLANAGLTGKLVTVAIGSVAVDTFQIDESANVLVQASGIELASLGQLFSVDFTDTGLRLEVVNHPDSFTLPTLFFAGVVVSAFEGNTLNGLVGGGSNIAGFDTLSSNGQSRVLAPPAVAGLLAFNFEGLALKNGDFVTVDMSLSPVPEPMPIALMLSGLGLLAFRLRRQG